MATSNEQAVLVDMVVSLGGVETLRGWTVPGRFGTLVIGAAGSIVLNNGFAGTQDLTAQQAVGFIQRGLSAL